MTEPENQAEALEERAATMTDAEILRWIDVINYDKARETLREYMRLRASLPEGPAVQVVKALTVSGPYHYEGDVHPSFRIDASDRIVAAVFASDGDLDKAERIASLEAKGWRPTHRHVKRGSKYRLEGYGEIQTGAPIGDYCKVAIYSAEDGCVWVRPVSEFEDGRFEVMPAAALSSSKQKDGGE